MRRVHSNPAVVSFLACLEKPKPAVVKESWYKSENTQIVFTLFAILAIGFALLFGGAKLIEHEAQETRSYSL